MTEALAIVASPGSAPAPHQRHGAGILLHKFVKADTWRGGLTPDITGSNLPTSGSAWIYEKQVLVSPGDRRVGATSAQIIKAVSERGYMVLAIADDA